MDAKRYAWSDLPVDQPMALLDRRRIIGQQAMISQVRLQRGCDVPMHAHTNEQFAMIVSGRLRFGVQQPDKSVRQVIVSAGEVLHLPANVPHSAYAEEDTLVFDIFSPPSEKTGIDRI
ncbi:MAG TPA: cupin domain-containing protein [Phycisphaerae bacterium]|nr:cupin domain-containing protein [Phycisphaerae bacterium]